MKKCFDRLAKVVYLLTLLVGGGLYFIYEFDLNYYWGNVNNSSAEWYVIAVVVLLHLFSIAYFVYENKM